MCNKLSCAIFLDSDSNANHARFDIFSAEPISLAQETDINNTDYDIYDAKQLETSIRAFADNPDNKYLQCLPKQSSYKQLPFTNGLIGFCSYTFGEKLQLKKGKDSPRQTSVDTDFPCFFVAHYTWSYIFDHQAQQGYLTFSPLCSATTRNKILALVDLYSVKDLESPEHKLDLSMLKWKKNQSFNTYQQQFTKIQQYINNGDCYQVNLTQRFEAESDLNAIDLYFDTREKTQTPYSCLICFNKSQNLLSFSPEQFISIKNRVIESKPIKGTIANNGNSENLDSLKNSKKNQAENVMIVDLIRNDLGQVCQPSSIHVPELFKVESYNNVHHLVSHIKGTLKKDVTELEAFFACFPGGSITGAPKIRSMEIINELEINSRSAYCGSVFYLNQNGNFDSNILIRTVVKDGKQLFCWAGGGIVADSEVLDEYQESLTKVANITGILK